MTECIKIGDKVYPYRVSYKAIKNTQNYTGKSFDEFGKHISDILVLLFYSIKVGCRVEKIEFKITLDELENAMEDDKIDLSKFKPSKKKV